MASPDLLHGDRVQLISGPFRWMEAVFDRRLSAAGRVRILLELAVEQGGKLVIPEKLTQKDIAARVGASREMINRILRDLTTGGYVTVEAGRITINKAPPARW